MNNSNIPVVRLIGDFHEVEMPSDNGNFNTSVLSLILTIDDIKLNKDEYYVLIYLYYSNDFGWEYTHVTSYQNFASINTKCTPKVLEH